DQPGRRPAGVRNQTFWAESLLDHVVCSEDPAREDVTWASRASRPWTSEAAFARAAGADTFVVVGAFAAIRLRPEIGLPWTCSTCPFLVTATFRPLPKTLAPRTDWVHDRWCRPIGST